MVFISTFDFFLDDRLFIDVPHTVRRLSDLSGIFADDAAYQNMLATDDPVVYQVSSVEPGYSDGDLHYGLAILMSGRIGDEYYMTKGHFHAYRPAGEVYIVLRGEGLMMLESETGDSQLAAMRPNSVVYVPGHTAHRTINTGHEPLVYIGVYAANAGHDYASIAETNFRSVVVQIQGQPKLMARADYLQQLDLHVTKNHKER
jgi:glucose-6-phosphate isomerase, archaeal